MRLKKGDDKALESLCSMYGTELLKFLLSITHSIEESEDIFQDVLMIIWNNRKNINEHKNFKRYLFKIAKNRMIDLFRKSSKEEILPFDIIIEERETPESILLKKERNEILQKAINLLPHNKKRYTNYAMNRKNP
jgi:RNA polymerase sigma-70 factor (ECF subfamily)